MFDMQHKVRSPQNSPLHGLVWISGCGLIGINGCGLFGILGKMKDNQFI